jgi:hypothetical protein
VNTILRWIGSHYRRRKVFCPLLTWSFELALLDNDADLYYDQPVANPIRRNEVKIMVRKASVVLFATLALVLLGGFVLTACETAGGPQATATPPPDMPKATPTAGTGQETPPTPQHVQPYPEAVSTDTPTPEAYPNP